MWRIALAGRECIKQRSTSHTGGTESRTRLPFYGTKTCSVYTSAQFSDQSSTGYWQIRREAPLQLFQRSWMSWSPFARQAFTQNSLLIKNKLSRRRQIGLHDKQSSHGWQLQLVTCVQSHFQFWDRFRAYKQQSHTATAMTRKHNATLNDLVFHLKNRLGMPISCSVMQIDCLQNHLNACKIRSIPRLLPLSIHSW